MSLPDDGFTHKIIDVLQHIWPYLSGLAITFLAALKLWWNERRETRKRLKNQEILVDHIIREKVSHKELQACRDDVRHDNDTHIDNIYARLDKHALENAQQHQDILNQIIRLHTNDN